MFSFPIPLVSIWLIIAALAGWAIACFYGCAPYRRASRGDNGDGNEPSEADEEKPGLSVVMYCQSSEEVLLETLETMSRQDYPNYEVIVVCDAGAEYAEYISELVTSRFQDVYVTFVQPGSHNLSRIKLANTIGIKAARGEVVLTTQANIRIPSDRWLSEMMAPFLANGNGCDAVLGMSHMDFAEFRGWGKWYRQFDTVLRNGQWIGYAKCGKGFRGDGFNLAFRRELFFANKGYSTTNYLEHGDDDVFLRQIAKPGRIVAVVNRDTILTTEWGSTSRRFWTQRKDSYSFTRKWLPKGPFVRSGVLLMMQWAVPGCCALAAVLGWPSIWPLLAGAVTTLAMWLTEIYCYRRLASRLEAVRLWWAVVPFMMWKPAGDALFRLANRKLRKKNFTWRR